MAVLTLRAKYSIEEGLIMSPSLFIESYLYGLPLFERAGYGDIYRIIKDKLLAAQVEFENFLNIKFRPQVIEESRDFIREEWRRWGFVRVTYPISKIHRLDGYVNDIRQITYPEEWLSIHQSSDKASGTSAYRNVYIIPNVGKNSTAISSAVVYSGITPHLGFLGEHHIPNYWRVTYCTGFTTVPRDIKDAIGKYASCQVLALLADITFGAGIASLSLGFDGFSQSLGTTQSAENSLYSARVKQYQTELKETLQRLKDTYRGMMIESV